VTRQDIHVLKAHSRLDSNLTSALIQPQHHYIISALRGLKSPNPIIMDITPSPEPAPSVFRYVIGFLLIGVAWGFTTPFIRAAARTHLPPAHPMLDSPSVKSSWIKLRFLSAFFGVMDLLRNPRYAIPLVINLTGSVWFFLLIGKAGEFPFSTLGASGEGCGKWGAWGELEVSADVAKLELSLTVPITNSLAFLFTVFGDWWVERKVISRGKLFSSS
jgi:hypothetical protein